MKRFFSGISIIVLLMIVVSSIVQFHHHDVKGNIIFAVTTICCDDANEQIHNQDALTGCNHCHHHDDHECGDGEDCSAHLGDYQATKQTVLSLDTYPTLLFNTIVYESTSYIVKSNSQKENLYIQGDTPINEGVRWVTGLRAPPYC